jgi:transcriptional regulator with XRE-family HTH domain
MSRQQKNKVFFDKVCDRIRLLTIERNLANYELATKAGISGKTIYSIINKRVEPSNKVISAIAIALNTSVDYLMTGEGEKRQSPMMVREGTVYPDAGGRLNGPCTVADAIKTLAVQLDLSEAVVREAILELAKKKEEGK